MKHIAHQPPPPLRIRQRGATLVELMIVVVVLGILTAIAVPSFKEMTANQRVKAAANDLLASLHFARSEAIKRNSSVYVVASGGANGWADGWAVTTGTGDTYAACSGATPPTSCLCVQPPMRSMTVSLNNAGLTSITYLRDGRFAAVTTTPQLSFCIPDAGKRVLSINLIGNPKVTVQGGCP